MSLDTYASIWNKVLLRCPAAGALLAMDWVSHAFRQIAERRPWSWLIRHNQFIIPAVYSTGTVTVTLNSATVTGVGTVWTSAMVGRQFRTGSSNPIYTIASVTNPTTLALDIVWGDATAAGTTYEIWQAYVTPQTDCLTLIAVVDTKNNWRLHLNRSQGEINMFDAMRATSGIAYLVAFKDYSAVQSGYPRFELWPHVKDARVYPYSYIARITDLEDGGGLPTFIRGDLLMEMALASAARWPGVDAEKPNPYFSLDLAKTHEARAERMLMELERQDDEVYMRDLDYSSMQFAPMPFVDSSWMQKHAFSL